MTREEKWLIGQLKIAKTLLKDNIDIEIGRLHYKKEEGFYSRDNFIATTWEELEFVSYVLGFDYDDMKEAVRKNNERYGLEQPPNKLEREEQ